MQLWKVEDSIRKRKHERIKLINYEYFGMKEQTTSRHDKIETKLRFEIRDQITSTNTDKCS